ncbi:MAG: ribonuclease P protein component [Elusimicrobia bacterium]|nr:ribonuclease P protein component [Elusimicrobiota bacterium]
MNRSTSRKIENLFSHGRRWRQGPLRFIESRHNSKDAEISLLIPRKSYPKAVERNRWRRLLRESLRQMKIQPTRELIVMAGPVSLVGLKEPQVQEWLRAGLSLQ